MADKRAVTVIKNKERSKIPDRHAGMPYQSFLAELTQKRRVKRYLEIGVQEGLLLSQVHAVDAVGVDPLFKITANISANKKRVSLVQATSDEFFSEPENALLLDGAPDFAFLDGMHTFEYLLRDFYNTEAIANHNTLIGMHDCLPLNEEMANRDAGESVAKGKDTAFPHWWTGDVWKIIPILKEYRPDLKLIFADAPPTGVVFVTNLNPSSSVLSDQYHEIVAKYREPNGSIERLYSSIEITPTSRILNQFDNTLFFRS